jgi:MYXO-CTERM domain-containing protein
MFRTVIASALAFSLAPVALAGEGGDVLILPDSVSGAVRTGAFDDATESIVNTNQRVFFADFGEADPLQPNFADEPGFRGLASDFGDGSSWSFNITGAVGLWNGADFSTPSPFTISLGFGPASVTSAAGSVSGFSVPVSGDDGFDDHLDVILDAPTDGTADGIYLLRLSIAVPGFADSDEIWWVLNRGLSETEHDAAIDFARANVPAPSSALALLGAGLLAGRRRR